MIKKFFTLLCLCTLCIGSSWGEVPATGSWDLTSSSDDWSATGNETYFSQPYGYKKLNGTLVNKNVADFTDCAKDGKTITSIKVGFKGLRNGATASKITISLVDKDGNILTSGSELELTNQSAASKTEYVYSTFTTGFTGATGFMMKVTTFGKNVLINGASYEIEYKEAGAPELVSIAVSGTPTKTTYEVGETFDPAGLTVTGTYDDASTADLTADAEWTITPATFTSTTQTSVSVTAKVSGKTSPNYTVNGLTVTKADVYTLVTSTDQLVAGAHYMIGSAVDDGKAYFMNTTSKDNNRGGTQSSVTENKVYAINGLLTLTLGGSADAWTFKTDNYGGTDGYLNATSTDKNYLNVVANDDKYNKFSISFGEGGNAIITCTGKDSRNIMRYNYNSGNPIFSCYSSGQNDIYLYRKAVEATITSTGYATFSSDCALDLSNLPEGLTAYKATTAGNDKVHMVAVEEAVAANTGLFLKGTKNTSYTIPVAASGTELDDNLLKATTGESLAEGDYVYVIASGAFQPLGQATDVSKGKAYIPASKITIPTEGKLEISFGEPTGITSYENDNENFKAMTVYNLQGVRVNNSYKGIVIMNGKKYINK